MKRSLHDREHPLTLLWQPGLPRYSCIVAALAWSLLLLSLVWTDPWYAFVQIGATLVIALFVYRPDLPIYLIAATYPFIEWQIVRGGFNAPVVDVIALLALCGWVVRLAWESITQKRLPRHLHLWAAGLFLLWAVSAFVSAYFSTDHAAAIKYVFRVLLFFIAAYVWLPLNDIRTSKQLYTILMILYVVGVCIAIYGISGFFLSDAPSFLERRVVPLPLFGLYPLGSNHNIIADVMITTIPIGFFLLQYHTATQQRKIIFIGILLLILTNMLTFSRSGWLALFLEMVVLIALLYRHHLKKIARYATIAGILAAPLFFYMVLFSTQQNVQSSNYNRTILNEIAWENFSEKPFFGQGPGTFISTVAYNRVYIEEFGAPLDAHGFIQKIASELGIFGLLSFFLILCAVVVHLYRTYRRFLANDISAYLMASLMMMVVGGIFFQLFQTSYFVSKLWFPIGVALAAAAIARETLNDSQYAYDKN